MHDAGSKTLVAIAQQVRAQRARSGYIDNDGHGVHKGADGAFFWQDGEDSPDWDNISSEFHYQRVTEEQCRRKIHQLTLDLKTAADRIILEKDKPDTLEQCQERLVTLSHQICEFLRLKNVYDLMKFEMLLEHLQTIEKLEQQSK